MTERSDQPTYSFVIPILDEQDTLPELHRRLASVMDQMDGPCEVVFVDDGSRDASFEVMSSLHQLDSRVRVIRLSRNFGHQVAITAGLDQALGDAAVIMDGDLQDPPEVALDLAAKWREGFDVVYAVRAKRDGETWLKRSTAAAFYRVMGRLSDIDMPLDAGDFRLVDRRAINAVSSMKEHHRYLRGLFAWVGYRQTAVTYSRDARYAGTTKFSLRKMMTFASDGILSFSTVPLRLALHGGLLVAALAIGFGVLAIILKVVEVYTVPGWASLTVGIAFLGGLQLAVLGVIGEYVARIHEEVKQRPLYLVSDRVEGDAVRSARWPAESDRVP